MIYISQLLGQQVWDSFGREIGRLEEVLVSGTENKLPPVVALAVKTGQQPLFHIPARQIASLWPSITLKVAHEKLTPYLLTQHELPLKDRVLDQQIVDTEGKRLVRVNDLQLARSGENFYLTGVDVSAQGLLRRLGMERIGQQISKVIKHPAKVEVIPWEFVASIEHDDPLRLRVSQNRIIKMPPADIASILDELDHQTTHALLQGFNNETLADTLEESSIEMQMAILSHLSPERAADVLEEMDPDEAADVLADLPDQTSEVLLDLMEDDNAEEVRSLLAYPEDSAGGIMTTEFAHVPNHLTIQAAINYLRESEDAHDDEVMYYVYIIDENRRFCGVVSLRDLVMAPPSTQLEQWEQAEPVSVSPLTPQEEVAYLIAKYDLLSVPVIDPDSGEMLGIVTVDDAIDTVLPTAWKKRLPRFF
ncbi:MAG: magnesium transporter [Anaerolineaceae bacterium]|nr:magnesium transporter [Anaerolineaceae bacterium]